MRLIVSLLLLACLPAGAQTYYIVRHAEKAIVPAGADKIIANDPPLSEEGIARSIELRDFLKGRDIQRIFSTEYKRTQATVAPLGAELGITVEQYASRPDSMDLLIARLKELPAENIVIAGHSNTIDDLANKICGRIVVPQDLPETEYDNIFILKKEGDTITFSRIKYGKPSS